jgi:hypothetical protein
VKILENELNGKCGGKTAEIRETAVHLIDGFDTGIHQDLNLRIFSEDRHRERETMVHVTFFGALFLAITGKNQSDNNSLFAREFFFISSRIQ